MNEAMFIDVRRVSTHGIELNVAFAGTGPPLLLVHGWPHTRRVWDAVLPRLAQDFRVIAPDLRGLGDSTRARDGYDARSLATDLLGILDAEQAASASVIALDAGVPPAFMMAMTEPKRITALVLMESLLGTLPGAETFLAGGAPWWFGFHTVPGLAETVLAGHEPEYIDFFLRAGTFRGRGIDPAIRDAFVAAYTGSDALRCGFEYYRAAPTNADQVRHAVAHSCLTVPTLAIGAFPVRDSLYHQLQPIADDVTGQTLEDCGHIIPLDRPDVLLAAVLPFLSEADQ